MIEKTLFVMTMAELFASVEKETFELKTALDAGQKRWGRWRFVPDGVPCLIIEPIPGHEYDVAVDDLRGPVRLIDWILHLREKTWIQPADLGNLVYAVLDLARVGRGGFKR